MNKPILILIPLALLGVYLARPENDQPPTTDNQQLESVREIPELGLSIFPETIIQGDPALVQIENLPATTTIKSLSFNGKLLYLFEYNNKPSALIGLDLRQTPGTYPIILTLSDGRTIRKDLLVGEKFITKAPLGIPEKLGGDTPEAEKELISTLVQEGALISAIQSGPTKLWSGLFRYPLNSEITITDVYGYSRLTGASTIAHKGTDFRAAVGTPVYAMNTGTVRFVRFLRNYGHTVILDHGAGLMTIYMHLSETNVSEGQKVAKGELIAKSGDTGYVLGPHLHLTVRINGISIDPMKFMALLGESY